MPLEILRARSTANDPAADQLLAYFLHNADILQLSEAVAYYGFPRYRDEDEELYVARVLIVSPKHGLILFGTGTGKLDEIEVATEGVFGQIYGKLVANRALRSGPRKLKVSAEAFVFAPSASATSTGLAHNYVTRPPAAGFSLASA